MVAHGPLLPSHCCKNMYLLPCDGSKVVEICGAALSPITAIPRFGMIRDLASAKSCRRRLAVMRREFCCSHPAEPDGGRRPTRFCWIALSAFSYWPCWSAADCTGRSTSFRNPVGRLGLLVIGFGSIAAAAVLPGHSHVSRSSNNGGGRGALPIFPGLPFNVSSRPGPAPSSCYRRCSATS